MSERKLVTIRHISDVVPIADATNIELVKIDGWQCVAKKGEFSVGDACLYFEVDSFLPEFDQRYSFLAGRGVQTNGDGNKGYRLRTIKLRGQLSQGLALPLSVFPEAIALHCTGDEADFSDLLGVTKWEPALPAQLAGQAKGYFPEFLRKTDQERVQNMPWVLEDTESTWEVTQKLDGSSMTVYLKDGEFGVCSRNLELKETEGNTFWAVSNKLDLKEALNQIGLNVALQGELIGPGIQGNPHGLATHDFYLFDVWLIDEQRYADAILRTNIADDLELKTAPFVSNIRFGQPELSATNLGKTGFRTVQDVLDYAESVPDAINPKNKAPEGLVFKRHDGKRSFKAISNKYLLKEK